MAKTLPLTFRGRVVGTAKIDEEGTISGEVDPSLLTPDERMDLFWDSWSTSYSIDTSGEEG